MRIQHKRLIRPEWVEEFDYLVGGPNKGFLGSEKDLEAWEKKIPCNTCQYGINDECYNGPCAVYNVWLSNQPLRKITKKIK